MSLNNTYDEYVTRLEYWNKEIRNYELVVGVSWFGRSVD